MREKIIKIFIDWCEKYKVEDYRINTGSNVCGEEDILFYIYESEIPLRICFGSKSIEFVFEEDYDICTTRIIDDSIIIEFADLCGEIRKVLDSYSF